MDDDFKNKIIFGSDEDDGIELSPNMGAWFKDFFDQMENIDATEIDWGLKDELDAEDCDAKIKYLPSSEFLPFAEGLSLKEYLDIINSDPTLPKKAIIHDISHRKN